MAESFVAELRTRLLDRREEAQAELVAIDAALAALAGEPPPDERPAPKPKPKPAAKESRLPPMPPPDRPPPTVEVRDFAAGGKSVKVTDEPAPLGPGWA